MTHHHDTDPIETTRATAGQFGHPADDGLIEREAALSAICSHAHYDDDWGDLVCAIRAIPAAQDGAEVELVTDADELRAELRRALAQIDSLEAECDRRHAQTEAAKNDVHRLAVAICGGEDFPGLLDAQPIEALVQEVKRQQAAHGETINTLLRAEAERADEGEAGR
ncbi:hypothetical protein [Paenirhodobacter enshiensis]|uniref:hypothetical protein n=1 Tax=Paenirhodobacter enshiensis TaxID=1105367 RepID=UPI0035B33A17